MNYRRAITAAIMCYGITLVIGVFAVFVLKFGFEDTASGQISQSTWVFSMVTSILATTLCALWYFRKEANKASLNTGIHLGLVILAISFALDFVSFLPRFTDPATQNLLKMFYANPFFWLTAVLVVVTTTLVAKYKEKKYHHAKPTRS